MNAKELKILAVGIGEMGKVGVRVMYEHGLNIVAAVDIHPDVIGKDLGEYSGYRATGLKIEDAADLKAIIDREKPNFAFMASVSELELLEDQLLLFAENGMNVITTGIEPYYPWNANPALAKKIDEAYRTNGVSLMASGINDVFWSGIGMDLAGTCEKIDSIDFVNKLPLENMGAGVAEEFCMNWDPAKFRAEMADKDLSADPSVGGPLLALYYNEDLQVQHLKDVNIALNPLVAPEDIPMPQWDMTIEKGKMLGQSFDIKMTTEEGILCTTSMIIKVMEEGEQPGTSWTIKGQPNLHLDLGDICGEITTSTISVNRIPDVITARPGIVTLKDIQSRPRYLHGEWTEI